MKYLKLLIPAGLLGFTMFLTSCQTPPSQIGLSAAEVMLRRDVARMFPPITLHASDRMTYGTLCQVVEHSTTFYCAFPESAPEGFPKGLCRTGAEVCLEVLGAPHVPARRTPSLPNT